MHPWLIATDALRVPTYVSMIAFGMAVATFVLRREARALGLPVRDVMEIAIVVLPGAWIGSRLGWAILDAPREVLLEDPLRLLYGGGYTFFGGVVFTVLLVTLASRRKGLDPARVLDAAGPSLAFGIGIGRLGCLGSGCCHGRPADFPFGVSAPWAVHYYTPGHIPEALRGVALHPSPLYEAWTGLLIYTALVRWRQRLNPPPGELILGFFVLYGPMRALLEVFRGDLERAFVGTFSNAQLYGLATSALALALILWRRRTCTPS